MIADHLRTQFRNHGHLIKGITLTTTSAVGSFINIIVIYASTKNSKLRTPTNCCILSLVVSDFLMAFLATPMAAVSSFYRRWVFGHTGCLYYAFLTSLMAYISIAMLTMISITRYILTVKTHLKHLITVSTMIRVVIFGTIWSLIWALAPLMGWNSYGLEAAYTSCSVEWNEQDVNHASFSLTIMTFQFVLPLCIMIFCYSAIFDKVSYFLYYLLILYN